MKKSDRPLLDEAKVLKVCFTCGVGGKKCKGCDEFSKWEPDTCHCNNCLQSSGAEVVGSNHLKCQFGGKQHIFNGYCDEWTPGSFRTDIYPDKSSE